MYVKITVKSVPGTKENLAELVDVDFVADLPAGFIGPAIGRALDEAYELKLLGGKKFSNIRRVMLHKDSTLGGTALPLIMEDLVPDGYYITVPQFDVHCTWPVDADDEFENAFDKFAIDFGESTIKPIVACHLSEKSKPRTEQGASSLLSSSSSDAQSVTPKRLKVYFSSAVHEEYRGGDADFMKAMIDGLHALGVDAVRLANANLPVGAEQETQRVAGKLITLDYYRDVSSAERVYEKKNLPIQIAAALDCMLEFMEEEQRKYPDIIPILHIQSRLPGSGSAFMNAATIDRFKKINVKVFITVHEWQFNIDEMEARASDVLGPTKEICKAADGAIFVNDKDQQASEVDDAAFIPIPITVAFENIDIDAVLRRPKRILMFGMLRPGKGFEQSVELGSRLLNKYLENYDDRHRANEQEWSVWVVGKLLADYEKFQDIVIRVYKEEIYKAVFPGDIKNWMKKLCEESEGDDTAFNRAVSAKLVLCDEARQRKYEAYRRLVGSASATNSNKDNSGESSSSSSESHSIGSAPRPLSEIEGDQEKITGLLKKKKSEALLSFLKHKDNLDKVKLVATQFENTWSSMSIADLMVYDCASKVIAAFTRLPEPPPDNMDMYCQYIQESAYKHTRKRLAEEKNAWISMPLPVFFQLDLDELALVETFKQCKYVYKPDKKGMADNASAMISPMANGCILFTNRGGVTPAEFVTAPLTSAPRVQTPERYKLDFAGRYADAIILSPPGKELTSDQVINVIDEREADGGVKNRKTLENLKHLTEHRYLPIMIAARNLIYYRRKLELGYGKIVIPTEMFDKM